MIEDKRIEMKNQQFIDTFENTALYYLVEEIDGDYELRFVTSHQEDYGNFVDNMKSEPHVYHLFKSYVFGQSIEWVESYNGYTDKCDVAFDLDERMWASLAQISLERDITVNEAINEILGEYIKKEKSYVEDSEK